MGSRNRTLNKSVQYRLLSHFFRNFKPFWIAMTTKENIFPITPIFCSNNVLLFINYRITIIPLINRKRKFIMRFLPLLFILFITISFAQEKQNVLEFPGDEISAEDFKMRYELTPRTFTDTNPTEAKKHFLYTLLAEKLWALEAESRSLDTLDRIAYPLRFIKHLYMRDILYKTVVLDSVYISPTMLAEGLKKSAFVYYFKYMLSQNKDEIIGIHQTLAQGVPFDSLLQLRPEAQEQKEAIPSMFGQFDYATEEIIFNLNVGEFSPPVRLPRGWMIFYLEAKENTFTAAPMEKDSLFQYVKNVIETREEQEHYFKFLRNLYGDNQYNADATLYNKLGKELLKIIKTKKPVKEGENPERIYVSEQEIINLEKKFSASELSAPFIKFPNDPVPLKTFIRHLAFWGFDVSSDKESTVANRLQTKIQELIQQQLLNRAAYKRGLENDPEVKAFYSMYKDNYLATILRNTYTDSARVTDEEAYQYFLEKKNENEGIQQVNIREIVTQNLETIEIVLNEMDLGASFETLACTYNESPATKGNCGETGFFAITQRPEITNYISDLKQDEIYGPVKTGNGFIIFQLLEKKEGNYEIFESFEKEKDLFRSAAFNVKFRNLLKTKTMELADKYTFEINQQALESIKVTTVPMVVYRHFGFGGRLLAVPFNNMFYKWFEEWENSKEDLP